MAENNHTQRIKRELKAAGVTRFGMKKFAIRYLPKIIHESEHIGGVVYGRYQPQPNGPSFNEGMIVATNLRVIFLDHKPGYTNTDEMTYEVVAGVRRTKAVFSSVTLHTRLGDFTVKFANSKCAEIFVRYVEKRRLEGEKTSNARLPY